ncbi:MAG: hypothetical protein EHM45_15915 [Desulfobacteraceae bacterium]|nr:MAG: hypothetical protein EHM45_15915 [Desulfobacteraceae bacterium]
MKKIVLIALFVCALLTGPLFGQTNAANYDDYAVSGPFTHQNLSIFLFSGKDSMPGKEIYTLEEALDKKILTVHETGDVNRLKITNNSKTAFVFIMAGDIVKGGKQDRTLQHSLIIEPLSKEVPIQAFCVEQGRWSPRSSDTAAQFSSSKDSLVSKQLKIASRGKKSQQEVWNEVANTRGKLQSRKQSGNNSAHGVAPTANTRNQNTVVPSADQGQTSLQLALEDKDIQKEIQKYCDTLTRSIESAPHAVGYAFAINGKINSADFFASASLFKKLWPKLIRASAVEALAERQTGSKAYAAISPPEITAWLADSEKGKQSVEAINASADSTVTESDANLKYEVYAKGQKNKWIHKNMIKK